MRLVNRFTVQLNVPFVFYRFSNDLHKHTHTQHRLTILHSNNRSLGKFTTFVGVHVCLRAELIGNHSMSKHTFKPNRFWPKKKTGELMNLLFVATKAIILIECIRWEYYNEIKTLSSVCFIVKRQKQKQWINGFQQKKKYDRNKMNKYINIFCILSPWMSV